VALDKLDELIELRLLLQTQRRAEAVWLVQGVLVEGLGGGDAVATLKEPGALGREDRDVVEVFDGPGSSGWISFILLYALAPGVSLIPKCFTPYSGMKRYLEFRLSLVSRSTFAPRLPRPPGERLGPQEARCSRAAGGSAAEAS